MQWGGGERGRQRRGQKVNVAHTPRQHLVPTIAASSLLRMTELGLAKGRAITLPLSVELSRCLILTFHPRPYPSYSSFELRARQIVNLARILLNRRMFADFKCQE